MLGKTNNISPYYFSDDAVQNDSLNIHEFINIYNNGGSRLNEKNLLLSILEVAILDYQKLYTLRYDKKFQLKFYEIRNWFFKENEKEKYHMATFNNICDTLNIEKNTILKCLQRQQ